MAKSGAKNGNAGTDSTDRSVISGTETRKRKRGNGNGTDLPERKRERSTGTGTEHENGNESSGTGTELSTEQVKDVVKKRGSHWMRQLSEDGVDMAPGENSRYIRHAMVSFGLPPIDISDPEQVADRIGAFRACVCSLVTTFVGLLLILLNLGGQAALLASGFLYGTSFSIGSLGISLLTRYIVGDAQYAEAYSTISLVTSIASALGVVAAGLAYDVTGSYAAPVAAGLALVGIAGGCLAYLRWRVTARPWEKRVRA